MKRMIVMLLTLFMAAVCMAQSPADEVTLTVMGYGETREDATNSALRSAIAQAYGVFVSTNTQILNDELVKDEIVTISSGNIKEYKEIANLDMPNGRKEVTVQATVSISKLINYAQSRGAEAEFAGATFARNLKMKELNKENEHKAMENLFRQISLSLPSCYTRQLNVGEPRMDADDVKVLIPMEVVYKPETDNINNLISLIKRTFDALSLTNEEVKEYKQQNIPIYKFSFMPEYADYRDIGSDGVVSDGVAHTYYLRQYYSASDFPYVFYDYFLSIIMEDNTGGSSKLVGTCYYGCFPRQVGVDADCYVSITEQTGLFSSFKNPSVYTPFENGRKCIRATGIPIVNERGLGWWSKYGTRLSPAVKFTISIPKADIYKYNSFTIKD